MCASAKGGAGQKGKVVPGSERALLSRKRLGCRGLGARVALVELGRLERPAVDQEAVDPARAPGERFTKDSGPAFRGRSLAGVAAAAPTDIASDNPLIGGDSKLCRIGSADRRGGNGGDK